jgi:hypothetical protein
MTNCPHGGGGPNSNDQRFLDILTVNRLGCGQGAFDCPDGDSDMIKIGHAICQELLSGTPEVSVEAQAIRHQAGFGRDQAVELVGAAEAAYCS